MLRYFGGVPVLLVPDNLKSAVTQPCRYEPQVQSTYAQFAAFYGCAVLPARPYKPRDKAKVEVAVLIVERWILARLRHQTFFSLAELNRAIGAWLVVLNDKPFKKLPGTRRSQFEQWDRPALQPLSTERFEFSEWKTARVHIDYHVEIEGHYYSVPHALVGQRVQVRVTAATVECFSDTTRVAAHARSMRRGAHTTLAEHMPKAHRKHMQWTPGRLLNWGADIGPSTGTLVKYLLENKPHPEHGYRACLGLLNLVKRYDATRVEAACARALHIGSPTRRSVVSILERGLDRQTLTPAGEADTPPLPDHDNVRGPDYYQ
jgi:transposase